MHVFRAKEVDVEDVPIGSRVSSIREVEEVSCRLAAVGLSRRTTTQRRSVVEYRYLFFLDSLWMRECLALGERAPLVLVV